MDGGDCFEKEKLDLFAAFCGDFNVGVTEHFLIFFSNIELYFLFIFGAQR